MNVVVTGATGFVGGAVCRALVRRGHAVTGAVRGTERVGALPPGVTPSIVGEIGPSTAWEEALAGAGAVVHLAARVHVRGAAARRAEEFRTTNVDGTRRLAAEAARAGVARLVFASSIAVNGSNSGSGELTEDSPPAPASPYARSKWQAERALAEVAADTGLRTLALRPPVVYGRGAPGSFTRLVGWIGKGLPVPVAAGRPGRSMIHADNLASAMADALDWQWDGHAMCLVADAERVSVAELAAEIARRIGADARVLTVPRAVFAAAAAVTGSRQIIALSRPLLVSIRGIRERFGWTPPLSLAEGLDRSLDPGPLAEPVA